MKLWMITKEDCGYTGYYLALIRAETKEEAIDIMRTGIVPESMGGFSGDTIDIAEPFQCVEITENGPPEIIAAACADG